MRYNFIALVLLVLLAFALVSCDSDNNYVKDSTASLKSDGEGYFVPNVYVDVQENEGNNLGGNDYGEHIIID